MKDGFDLATQLVNLLYKSERFAKLRIQVGYEPPFFRTEQMSDDITTLLLDQHENRTKALNDKDDLCLRSTYKISKFGNLAFWKELKNLKEKAASSVVSKNVKLR